MCDNCIKYQKQLVIQSLIIREFRNWLANRECQFRPHGLLSEEEIDLDRCLHDCNIDDLIGIFDKIIKGEQNG